YRGVEQPLPVGVLADRLEDLPHRLGGAVEVHRGVDGRELPAGPLVPHVSPSPGAQVPDGRGARRLRPRRRSSRTASTAPSDPGAVSTAPEASATVTPAGGRGPAPAGAGSWSSGRSMPAPLSMWPKASARSRSSRVSFSTSAAA